MYFYLDMLHKSDDVSKLFSWVVNVDQVDERVIKVSLFIKYKCYRETVWAVRGLTRDNVVWQNLPPFHQIDVLSASITHRFLWHIGLGSEITHVVCPIDVLLTVSLLFETPYLEVIRWNSHQKRCMIKIGTEVKNETAGMACNLHTVWCSCDNLPRWLWIKLNFSCGSTHARFQRLGFFHST